jgi:cytochrome c oxidase assembly protein subunit 11
MPELNRDQLSGAPRADGREGVHRRDLLVAAGCGAFVALMVAPDQVIGRRITVRFDANVTGGLPWKFAPERNSIDLKIGEVVTVLFKVTNLSARDTVGEASYNVTPPTAGSYFDKINCFCFTTQRLKPGEQRDMAVVFFVDPALARDAEEDDLNTITLSYTMYPVRESEKPLAANDGNAGRI